MTSILGHSKFAKRRNLVTLLVGLLILLVMVAQYFSARQSILSNVEMRSLSELRANGNKINGVTRSIETAVMTMVKPMERNLSSPDSVLYAIMGNVVKANDLILSCAVAFKPDFRLGEGRWCEYAISINQNGEFVPVEIGDESHDYFSMEWYRKALDETNGCYWSEPYPNGVADNEMVVTCSTLLRDKTGKAVGVLCADVSLSWLREFTNHSHNYPGSYNIVLSRGGRFLVYPEDSVMSTRFVTDSHNHDETVAQLYRSMLAGDSGTRDVNNADGKPRMVAYGPIQGTDGWSMAIVVDKRVALASLYHVSLLLLCLLLVSLALLGFIVYRSMNDYNGLQEATARKSRLEGELKVAGDIQQSMLPARFPTRDDVDVASLLKPAREVGGDLYDWYLRDEKLYFMVGDVSGKGVPAALVMAVTSSLFRSMALHESNPAHIVTSINTNLAVQDNNNMFVTLFVGVLDLPTGRLRYCNAGHDTPLLITHEAQWMQPEPNLPVGLVPDFEYKRQEIQLPAGAMLFLYTDGLTEALNVARERLGSERVMEVCKRAMTEQASPAQLIEMMSDEVMRFAHGSEPADDLTMLALSYHPLAERELWRHAITLPCEHKAVARLGELVGLIQENVALTDAQAMNLRLAVEEAVVNVMNYAYPTGEGTVTVNVVATASQLRVSIIDTGKAFDPTAMPAAETRLDVEERSAGGLGIYLFRRLVDGVNYERVNDKNVLTFQLNINSTHNTLKQ